MTKILLAGLAAALCLGGPAASAQVTAPRTVVSYEGEVDAQTAARFTEMIVDNVDQVIGLQITVTPSQATDRRYFVALGEDHLNVTSGDPMNGPTEVLIAGDIGRSSGDYTADGFYLVKSGGMHAAGATSWALRPVDEANLRLNPDVRIVTRPF